MTTQFGVHPVMPPVPPRNIIGRLRRQWAAERQALAESGKSPVDAAYEKVVQSRKEIAARRAEDEAHERRRMKILRAPSRRLALIERFDAAFKLTTVRARTMREIIAAVAEAYGLTPKEVTGHRRSASVVAARQEGMWRCAKETGSPVPAIAKVFDGRDHTTVLHGIRRHAERIGEGK